MLYSLNVDYWNSSRILKAMIKSKLLPALSLCCFTVMMTSACEQRETQPKPDDRIILPVDTLSVACIIGVELGEWCYMFWDIIAVDIDKQGRILVLDRMAADLKAYDMQGNYIQCITRKGEGPGEVLCPRGLAVFPDGRILVTAPSKFGYVIFDEDFELVEEVRLWYNNSPYHVTPISNDRIVASRFDCSDVEDTYRHTVAIYDLHTEDWDVLLWKDSMEVSDASYSRNPSELDIFIDEHLLKPCCDASGNIFFAVLDSEMYRVIQWDSLGNDVLEITRDMTPVEKAPVEICDETFYLNAVAERMWGPQPCRIRPLKYKNMVIDVGIGYDQNLWVRRGTRNEPFFDVYEMDGTLLRHVIFPASGYSWQTRITPYGVLAWERDPWIGYQKVYFLK